MTYLWCPDPKRMDELGYGSIAFVPVLFDANWNYHTELNRYLRERALLEWQPKDVDSSSDRVRHVSQNQYPTKKTLENIARQLCNFFDWIAWKNLEWKSIEYTKHLVRGYQLHMLKGSWSARKKPLSAGTINIRVRAACAFMAWAAERGFREDFKVKSAKRLVRADSGTHAHGHKALETNARAGRVRSNPASLRITTEAELDYFTALTGSGPAFLAAFADAMISDAVTKGIEHGIAERAVRQLFLGGSVLMAGSEQTPAEIVQTFLDYAGTTAAGLEAMAAADIRTPIARGLTAAAAKAAAGMRRQ